MFFLDECLSEHRGSLSGRDGTRDRIDHWSGERHGDLHEDYASLQLALGETTGSGDRLRVDAKNHRSAEEHQHFQRQRQRQRRKSPGEISVSFSIAGRI